MSDTYYPYSSPEEKEAQKKEIRSGGDAGGINGVAADQLRSIVERIERLEEEKKAIADDVKEVYAEAKANGYDTKTLRKVVTLRKVEAAERQEQEAMLDLYMHALGMISEGGRDA